MKDIWKSFYATALRHGFKAELEQTNRVGSAFGKLLCMRQLLSEETVCPALLRGQPDWDKHLANWRTFLASPPDLPCTRGRENGPACSCPHLEAEFRVKFPDPPIPAPHTVAAFLAARNQAIDLWDILAEYARMDCIEQPAKEKKIEKPAAIPEQKQQQQPATKSRCRVCNHRRDDKCSACGVHVCPGGCWLEHECAESKKHNMRFVDEEPPLLVTLDSVKDVILYTAAEKGRTTGLKDGLLDHVLNEHIQQFNIVQIMAVFRRLAQLEQAGTIARRLDNLLKKCNVSVPQRSANAGVLTKLADIQFAYFVGTHQSSRAIGECLIEPVLAKGGFRDLARKISVQIHTGSFCPLCTLLSKHVEEMQTCLHKICAAVDQKTQNSIGQHFNPRLKLTQRIVRHVHRLKLFCMQRCAVCDGLGAMAKCNVGHKRVPLCGDKCYRVHAAQAHVQESSDT